MSTTRKHKPAPSKAKATKAPEPRLSRLRRPPELKVVNWQTALRRQFGREQRFGLKNIGQESIFSDFVVNNPDSRTRYRVAIRGPGLGQNFCSCPDYATNDLGTCKHIEFALAKLQAMRGGKAALKRGFRQAYSDIWLDYAGARRVRFTAGTDCPRALLEQARLLFDDNTGWSLRSEQQGQLERLLQTAQELGHELRCYDDVWQFIAQIRDGARRQKTLSDAYPLGIKDKALSQLLKVKLYPYQLQGALFAARAGRSLIGDEMGLGKTVQAIAAAELFAQHFGVRRVLVVCPTSLKHQWKNEFARFAEHEVQVIQGLRGRRELQYREESFCKITHYESLARDADLIATWAPDLVIADEAQRIKNWNTIAARALKRIVSPYCVVLTGTPLENRLEELISIVQFVDQHRLGPTWRLLDEHQTRDESGRVIGYRALDRIGQTLSPVMLRRRKAEVLTQLPERVDNRIFVPLTPQQRAHHDENGGVVTRIVQRWRKTGYLSDADQRRLHCALQNMRMACNSTFLLDHESDHGNKVDELMTVLNELFEDPSAKAVIFSQWLGTHELIQRRLGKADGQRDWGHVLFSGSVPGDKRGGLVEQFHADPACRLFLSTDAGGVGLNLQHAAAVVVNMDQPWNPAVLEQRIGRVHRMGQSRGVQVINFIGQGAIEEGMLSVLAFKKSLFAGVLDGGEVDIFMQGTKLSKFMESVEKVTEVMPKDEERGEGEAQGESASNRIVNAASTPLTADVFEPATTPETYLGIGGNTEAGAIDATAPCSTPIPAADPWVAILEAGTALLQSLASSRGASGTQAPPLVIERDPVTGQASVRLPLPDPSVLQRLAKAFEPWLK